MTLDVAGALEELTHLTACRCDPAYATRNLLDPTCQHDYREDVDILRAALNTPQPCPCPNHAADSCPDDHPEDTEP